MDGLLIVVIVFSLISKMMKKNQEKEKKENEKHAEAQALEDGLASDLEVSIKTMLNEDVGGFAGPRHAAAKQSMKHRSEQPIPTVKEEFKGVWHVWDDKLSEAENTAQLQTMDKKMGREGYEDRGSMAFKPKPYPEKRSQESETHYEELFTKKKESKPQQQKTTSDGLKVRKNHLMDVDLRHAMIWKEILDQPVSRRRRHG